MSFIANYFADKTWTDIAWLTFGFAAQSMFFMRFVIQWIASEKAKASIVPETFWYFSFVGGVMLLTYATLKVGDPVFILGQAMGLVIYSRNIYLIWKNKRVRAEVSERMSQASGYKAPAE